MNIIDTVEINIMGKPIPKGMPRFNRKTGHMYTAARTARALKAIKAVIWDEYQKEIVRWHTWEGMVGLCLVYYMPFMSRLRKAERVEGAFHVIKPDLDNLVKLTVDAINGYLFRDDSQVAFITARKLQSAEPRTFVEVSYYE